MNRLPLWLFLIASAAGSGCAQAARTDMVVAGSRDQRTADLAAIERLHEADMRAVVAGDTATLMSLWTDDIVSLPPGAPIQVGRAANAEFMRRGMQASASFEPVDYRLEFREVQLFGDHAVEWGTYRARVRPRGGGQEITSGGKVMRVLRRQPDGSWKVARTIFTADP
jgi:uncharacterized protein (TIGR02246 family)